MTDQKLYVPVHQTLTDWNINAILNPMAGDSGKSEDKDESLFQQDDNGWGNVHFWTLDKLLWAEIIHYLAGNHTDVLAARQAYKGET